MKHTILFTTLALTLTACVENQPDICDDIKHPLYERDCTDSDGANATDLLVTIPNKKPPPAPDREPSLADIAVEAELKRLMGEPLDPLEESLLND